MLAFESNQGVYPALGTGRYVRRGVVGPLFLRLGGIVLGQRKSCTSGQSTWTAH